MNLDLLLKPCHKKLETWTGLTGLITFWPGFRLSRLIARRASPKGIKLGARTKMIFSSSIS